MPHNSSRPSFQPPAIKLLLLVGLISFLCWLAPRFIILNEPVLLFDDYYFIADVEPGHEQSNLVTNDESIYLYSFRPSLYLLHKVTNALIPDYFQSALPKLLSGIYQAIFCCALFWLLIYFGFEIIPGIIFCALLCVHFITNNTTLWNVFNGVTLGYFCCALGFIILINAKNRLLPLLTVMSLWLFAIGAYQTNLLVWLTIWLIILISYWVNNHSPPLILLAKALGLFVCCYIIYSIYIKIYCQISTSFDPRILSTESITLSALEFRFKKILNIQVNLSFSVLVFYLGKIKSMSLWYLLPILLSAGVFISGVALERKYIKWLIISALLLALPFLAASPLLAISRPSMTWRMSFPSLLGYCFTILVLTNNCYLIAHLKPKLKLLIVVLASGVVLAIAPVTYLEAKARIFAYQNDQQFIESDKIFWKSQGVKSPVKAFVFAKDIQNYRGNTNIYSGYDGFTQRTTFQFSALTNDFSWGGFLAIHGYDLHSPTQSRQEILNQCLDNPDQIDEASGFKISRDLKNKISYFCHE